MNTYSDELGMSIGEALLTPTKIYVKPLLAAIEAADVVLMDDDIGKLAVGMKVARNTRRIVNQNVTFALGFKILVLLLSIPGIATMWMAVFADVGVCVLAILNAMRRKD